MSFTDQSNDELYNRNLVRIEDLCRSAFTEIGAHGWEHVIRVRALCKRVGIAEGADLKILDLAALFHDIMRVDEDHALRSAEFAGSVLSSMGFDKYFIARIKEAVASHSFSAGRLPISTEGKVLSDCDRLEAMGSIGIYRTVQYNLENNLPAQRVADHIHEKLLKLESYLYTDTAKRMARERILILNIFLESFERELSDASAPK
jgi:uncharacterized protein